MTMHKGDLISGLTRQVERAEEKCSVNKTRRSASSVVLAKLRVIGSAVLARNARRAEPKSGVSRTVPSAESIEQQFPFIEVRSGHNIYAFECAKCRAHGELGVKPEKTELVHCPGGCGALYAQRRPAGMFGHPWLEYVTGGSPRF